MTLNEALILSYIKRGIGYGYSILNHVKESRSDEWVDFSRAGRWLSYAVSPKGLKEMVAHAGQP